MYYSNKHERDEGKTGMSWNVKLCTWIIREARALWTTRNQETHLPENGNSKAEQEIYAQIHRLYDMHDEIGHQDRILLEEPIEEKLKRPLTVLRQWIRNTVPVINRCIYDYQNKLRTGQRDIRQYFQRVQPIPAQTPCNNSINQSGSTIPE